MRQEVYVKFAEALNARRMSQDKVAEAYAAGFCKAAEAMGVDPAELYKQAGLGQLLGRGLTAVRGIAGRAAGAYNRGASAASASGAGKIRQVLGGLAETGRGAGRNIARMYEKAEAAHPIAVPTAVGTAALTPVTLAVHKGLTEHQNRLKRIDEFLDKQQD